MFSGVLCPLDEIDTEEIVWPPLNERETVEIDLREMTVDTCPRCGTESTVRLSDTDRCPECGFPGLRPVE